MGVSCARSVDWREDRKGVGSLARDRGLRPTTIQGRNRHFQPSNRPFLSPRYKPRSSEPGRCLFNRGGPAFSASVFLFWWFLSVRGGRQLKVRSSERFLSSFSLLPTFFFSSSLSSLDAIGVSSSCIASRSSCGIRFKRGMTGFLFVLPLEGVGDFPRS